MSGIRIPKIWLVMVIALLQTADTVAAIERYVPSEYSTIQAAIDDAVDGDTVIIAPGTYTGDGNRDIDFLGKAITVRSIDPNDSNVVATTVIDCNGTPADPHRGFYFHNGEGPNSVLSGITIRSGYGPPEPYSINTDSAGGAICCVTTSPRITYCTLTGNEAGAGGALHCYGGCTEIVSCYISNNRALPGAGINCRSGTVRIIECEIVGNAGEGTACCYGDLYVDRCMISENSGKGINVWDQTATIQNTVFSKNNSGAIRTYDVDGTIANCTVINNTGDTAARLGSPTPGNVMRVKNCIFWGNTRPGWPLYQIEPMGSSVTVTYSNVRASQWGGGYEIAMDPLLEPNDYHLRYNSPCIDTGDPAGNYSGQTDIDGQQRVAWSYVDMGADEFLPESSIIEIWPTEFNFEYFLGDPTPENQVLFIRNKGVETLNWEISYDCNWIDTTPTAGQSVGEVDEVTIEIDVNEVAGGVYIYTLTISDPNAVNSPQYVTVILDVKTPLIGLTPTEFDFVCPVGSPNPEPQMLSVWNDGVCTLNWHITEDCNWLDVEPNSGSSKEEANEVTLTVDGSGLGIGTYYCNLMISDPVALNSPQTIPVTLRVCKDVVYVPEQFSAIQDAIDHVLEEGTVIVERGIYSGLGNRNIDFKGKAITVRSVDPNDPNVVASTIIDCNSLGRGFYFNTEEDSNSILAGFTITNGYAEYGGGIYCRYSNPTITNCIITGNKAYSYPGGGGVWSNDSSPTLTNCIITHNLSNNFGGGIYNGHGNTYIVNCIISENVALVSGGGIYNSHTYPAITDCVITGNKSGEKGGGLYCWGGDSSLNNCTISDNITLNNGGGIYSTYGNKVTLVNCILWENMANAGPQIALFADRGVKSKASISYSDVQGGQAVVHVESGCTMNWGTGNIDSDPRYVNPDSNDYHLLPDSPCINAGDPNYVAGPNETDMDGELRVMLGRIDMGADEFNPFETSFDVVGRRRISRTIFEYECSVTLRNIWRFAVRNVQLEIVKASENMVITDPDVTFDDIEIGPGESAISIDTCTFQVDRSEAIEPAKIIWKSICAIAASGQEIQDTALGMGFLWLENNTGDSKVDFEDLAALAGQWLWVGSAGSIPEDITGDGIVNLRDFAELAATSR